MNFYEHLQLRESLEQAWRDKQKQSNSDDSFTDFLLEQIGGKVSELQLIYKFLGDYANTGVINTDGTLYAVSACVGDKADGELMWHNGETISYAIHKLYEQVEKEQEK